MNAQNTELRLNNVLLSEIAIAPVILRMNDWFAVQTCGNVTKYGKISGVCGPTETQTHDNFLDTMDEQVGFWKTIVPENCNLFVVSSLDRQSLKKLESLCFEQLPINGIYSGDSSLMACFACAVTNAIVVDLSSDQVTIVPVLDSVVQIGARIGITDEARQDIDAFVPQLIELFNSVIKEQDKDKRILYTDNVLVTGTNKQLIDKFTENATSLACSSAFHGDSQIKQIKFCKIPEYFGSLKDQLVNASFIGAAIAVQNLESRAFTARKDYEKHK